MKGILALALGCTLLCTHASYAVNALCKETKNAYGPYDYSSAEDRENKLPIVEQYHFNSNVENLIKGISASVNGDLDYTLRTFPNHHRALMAMVNYKLLHPAAPESTDAAECYLTRAITFKPNDPIVHLIYGIYYQRTGKLDAALGQMLEAATLDPNNANIAYNLGLLYFDKKDLDKSEEYAKQAYDAGFPLKGLRMKLVKAGRLKDYPPPGEKAPPPEKPDDTKTKTDKAATPASSTATPPAKPAAATPAAPGTTAPVLTPPPKADVPVIAAPPATSKP